MCSGRDKDIEIEVSVQSKDSSASRLMASVLPSILLLQNWSAWEHELSVAESSPKRLVGSRATNY